jgi:hypothetical protein
MGPFYDLVVRRSQLPSGDMWKAAIQKDKRYAHAFNIRCLVVVTMGGNADSFLHVFAY